MNRRTGKTLAFALAASALPQSSAAEEPPKLAVQETEYVVDAPGEEDRRQGLDWQLNTGATFTLNNNASVVGQPDGSTFLFGFKVDALVNYNRAKHEWRNTVGIGAGMARNPLVDEFVKSRDALDVESLYLYHAAPSFGPFTRFVLSTSMFRSTDVRPKLTTYEIKHLDDTKDVCIHTKKERIDTKEVCIADRLVMTDPFRPLSLKQSLGAFAHPFRSDAVSFEVRAGVGVRETIAKGEFALSDDAATPQIEVIELDSVVQLGAEATAQVSGALAEKRALYRVTVEAMTPFGHSTLHTDKGRSALDLTNASVIGSLSFKLVDWASLDYELRVVREPQLIDELQVQNNLLFTLGLSAGTLPKAR